MVTEFDVVPTIIGILVIVIPSMLLGRLCARFRISEIFGFILGGIIFGHFAIGGLIPLNDGPIVVMDDLMLSIWQISGIVILFSAGLHFTFHDLRRAGMKAASVGIGGVIVPLILGYFVTSSFGYEWQTAIVIGATLSATSIAISVTALEEIRKEKTTEGNVLVNAAVLDDVLGIAILSAILSIIVTNSLPTIETITLQTIESVGFWFLLLLGAVFLLPKIVHATTIAHPTSIESRGINQAVALGSAFGLAAISGGLGLNPIIGAFAAGMGLADSKLAMQAREFAGRLKVIFTPLFFAVIGAHVNLDTIFDINVGVFLGILGVAVVSKILGCGIPASFLLKNREKGLRVGYGMIARGEIAFVTVGFGLSYAVIDQTLYSTMIFVVLSTIFIAPELLRLSYRNQNANNHKSYKR